MKIAFEVNGVLRNTFGKAEEVYQKFFIDDYVQGEDEEEFEYKLNLPITSTTLSNHFVFPDEERLMEFFYVDFPMNIFGLFFIFIYPCVIFRRLIFIIILWAKEIIEFA